MRKTVKNNAARSAVLLLLVAALLMGLTAVRGVSVKAEAVQTEAAATADAESFATTAGETAPADTEAAVKAIQEKIAAHWPHLQKIWPTYNYEEHNLVLFYLDQEGMTKSAWLLNSKAWRQLEENEYSEIFPPQPGGYEKLDFAGKRSIAMSFDDEAAGKKDFVDELYRVATHELVHFYYQDEIAVGTGQDSRTQAFPVDKTPRLYRQMIYQNLIRAYDEPAREADFLGKAKYWLDKWKSEYAGEYAAIRTTDIAEATARYTDKLGMFMTADLSAEAIYQEAGKQIDREEIFYSADAESYEIGYVAALLLDKRMPGWKDGFYKEDKTVEEKLLADVAPVEEPIDPAVESRISNALDTYNKETGERIEDIVAAKKDKSVPYLKIDVSNAGSSMAASGMIRYEGDEVFIAYNNRFRVDDKALELTNINVFDVADDDGNNYLYVPLSMPFELKDETLTVKTEKLLADAIKVSAEEEDGRTVYAVRADGDAMDFSEEGEGMAPPEIKALPEDTRPQDDFYESVNAKTINAKELTAEEPSWDQFSALSAEVGRQLHALIGDLAERAGEHEAGSAEKAVADLYASAKDHEAREQVKFGSLAPYLADLAAADSIASYLDAVARIRKELGRSSLFSFEPSPDPADSSRYALFFDDPVLPAKKEHLEMPDTDQPLGKYVGELLRANGMAEAEAASWSEKLVAFYRELAAASLSAAEKNEIERTSNTRTLEQMQADLPGLDLAGFLEKSSQAAYTNWVVLNQVMMPQIQKYLNEENLELLKQYSIVSLLNDYAPYLTAELRQAQAAFSQADNDEDELAFEAVQNAAEMEVGELYAKRFFSENRRAQVEKLVRDILGAYRRNIESLDWMSEASRAVALKKIDAMGIKVGYPDSYDSAVKGLDFAKAEGKAFIDHVVVIDRLRAEKEHAKGSAAVDRGEWGLSPQTLNAFYDPSTNEIVFPAAMLQAPFYDEAASYAENLGGIGAVIGHEITHAFDDAGSKYDEKGNYGSWWSDEDKVKFKEKAQQFVNYFGAYEVVPGHKVDGEMTLGENIADAGGLSVISSILADDTEALQAMFRRYAMIWANKTGEEELIDQLKHDEHAPSKVRVNGVLSSTEAFYRAFDVKPGDSMYVEPEKRVKMY